MKNKVTFDLTQEEAQKYFYYNDESGKLYWKKPTARCVKIGDIAGCPQYNYKHKDKVIHLIVVLHGHHYLVHRIIFALFHGDVLCLNKVIDHIDGNPENNLINNLRLVTNRENCQNRKDQRESGKTGYYWFKATKKWRAEIREENSGIRHHLGYFCKEEEAQCAYLEALRYLKENPKNTATSENLRKHLKSSEWR